MRELKNQGFLRGESMRLLKTFCVTVLASSFMLAQTSTPNTGSDASNIANEVKQLQDAIAAQQKAMAEQQEKIAAQQAELEKLKQQMASQPQTVSTNGETPAPHVLNATLSTPNVVPAVATASDVAQQPERPSQSPLSFRIGGAEFTPGGFVDFTGIFRSVNTGNLGTNFFNIPFGSPTTAQTHLSEARFTAQNSRASLKVTDRFGKNDVTGYLEVDFLGNDAANVFVTSNSHTFRQRLYWVDVKHDKFEVLAGQSWSWLTPNRNGLSPLPADVFYSQNMDFNYQAGLTWTRAPQIRFAYHPSNNLALGVAFENPQQFAGQANQVRFPGAFPTVSQQFDVAGNLSTPNLHPDIIPKVAYDTNVGGRHFHAEAAGLLSTFKIAVIPTGTTTFVTHSKMGGGAEAAVNLELIKNFRIVANGFYSDGGGRYIFGMGPDVVVLPTSASGSTCGPTTGCDAQLSLVRSASGIGGVEAQVTPKTLVYGYLGGAYFKRNFVADPSSPGSFAGYGFPGGSNAVSQAANRAILEPTVGWIQTFWRDPQHGALQLITQGSYLSRTPWVVNTGTPKSAHLTMVWVDLRYILP
jgi:hypothetical protein